MFNREYQRRATRQGISTFLAREFYRPAKLPDPRSPRRVRARGAPEQLTLQFDGPREFIVPHDKPQPLKDVFPEAYPSSG